MYTWTPADWILIIGAIFAGITSTIGAWHARKANNKATVAAEKSDIAAGKADAAAERAINVENRATVNSNKLDEIHTLTNGNLSRTQEELEQVTRQRDYLDKLVIELTARCTPGTLEKAKKDLDQKQAQIGKRRKTDLERKEDRINSK